MAANLTTSRVIARATQPAIVQLFLSTSDRFFFSPQAAVTTGPSPVSGPTIANHLRHTTAGAAQ